MHSNNKLTLKTISLLLLITFSVSIFFQGIAIAKTESDIDKIWDIYAKLEIQNSLNTGLKIKIFQADESTYENDGKTLKISSALASKLLSIDGDKAMALFLAREISYVENTKAGLSDFQLEYFSDKAGILVANNAKYDVSVKTFKSIVDAIDKDPNSPESRDKIRTFKLGVSQYVTQADLMRLISNKMRRGVTIKKGVNVSEIDNISGWNPILKNALGGALGTIATYYGLNVASNILDGYPISQSLKKAVKSTFTPEFLVGGLAGSLIGGTIGSIAGGLIPIPGAGPILSAFITTSASIFGANLGSEFGTNAILDYKRNKSFSLQRVWDSMDVSYLIGHSAGMAAGMALGSALIPIPFIGGLIGGVVGGFLGTKVSKCIASLYHKLHGSVKKINTENIPLLNNLPWLKSNAETKENGNSQSQTAAKTLPAQAAAGSDAELLNAKQAVTDTYQKYIKLLETETDDSSKLNNALNEFKEASERYKQISGGSN